MNGAILGTFLATVLTFSLVMLALGLGLLLGRPPLKGTCGGPGAACPCDSRDRPCLAEEKHA